MKLLCILLLLAAPLSGQWPGSSERYYDSGTRALDRSRWEDASRYFGQEVDRKGSRADAALYWKAYAESRMGHREAALASLTSLRRDFPASRWLNDAQALEVEVKAQTGSPVSPDSEQNEDLKMLALNGLLHSDPDQAVPIIEKLLRKSTSRKLKERALFVLTQSKSPKAMQVLHDAANGAFNPDVQIQAIHMYGVGQGNGDELVKIYSGSKEPEVKREAVNALFIQHNAKALVELARKEQVPAMKQELVQKLSIMRSPEATGYLVEILNK